MFELFSEIVRTCSSSNFFKKVRIGCPMSNEAVFGGHPK